MAADNEVTARFIADTSDFEAGTAKATKELTGFADAGGARLAGRDKMIAALSALQDSFRLPQPPAEPSLAAMKISGTKPASLFSTHPSLEERIEALRRLPL